MSLYVGVRVDAARFRSSGEFVLELVPADETGHVLVSEPWQVATQVSAPTAIQAQLDSQHVQPADTVLVATAINIDDSGSMRYSDPGRNRASAARLFWSEVLGDGSVAALLDFGRGSLDTPSPGFRRTRLLQGFTASPGLLDDKVDSIQAVPGGNTPLYHSAFEVVRWADSSVSGSKYKRCLVIITDGFPRDSLDYRDSLFAAAAAANIRIIAVGIGPASDGSLESVDSAVAVVRELATKTGGLYAGATTVAQLLPVLQALASVIADEQLLASFRLSPIPPSGTPVFGRVTVISARGTASANWSFVAP